MSPSMFCPCDFVQRKGWNPNCSLMGVEKCAFFPAPAQELRAGAWEVAPGSGNISTPLIGLMLKPNAALRLLAPSCSNGPVASPQRLLSLVDSGLQRNICNHGRTVHTFSVQIKDLFCFASNFSLQPSKPKAISLCPSPSFPLE